jgi:hypothetical protein
MTDPMSRTVYCTVVAQNYLGQALALHASIRRQQPERQLVILVVDGDRRDLESGREGLKVASLSSIGMDEDEIHHMAAIYDVVEFSTAVKPTFFLFLLEEFEQVVYLDPDTYVVAPLLELEGLIDEHGLVLTPHFLKPIPASVTHITEIHSLTVGIHNLGFCAVGRSRIDFLEWWAAHLARECLIYPLLGIFVDQKWTDVGANLFQAHTLRHAGYNVGPWNLHERVFEKINDTWTMVDSREALRLLHFSGFDPKDPEAISVRLSLDLKGVGIGTPALATLSREYAEHVLAAQRELGPSPRYGYAVDAGGRPLSKRTRRAYRKLLLSQDRASAVPSPFKMSELNAFRRWKAGALPARVGLTAGDAALAVKYVLPDEFGRVKKALPGQFAWLRARLLAASKVRR